MVPGVEKISSSVRRDAAKPAAAPAPVAAQEQEVPQTPKYYIIVATFHDEADCREFISQQQRPDELDIVCSGKACRVYSHAGDDRDSLQAILSSDAHRATYSQAWIWTDPAAE